MKQQRMNVFDRDEWRVVMSVHERDFALRIFFGSLQQMTWVIYSVRYEKQIGLLLCNKYKSVLL